ncbi:hypothetical protein CsatB_017006 [Cannabis sativa]
MYIVASFSSSSLIRAYKATGESFAFLFVFTTFSSLPRQDYLNDDLNPSQEFAVLLEFEGFTDFNNANNVDEVESMSVSDVTRSAQSHTQSDGSSKRKRKATNHEELSNALTQLACIIAEVIEKASIRLSKAIGKDLNEKHMQLG